MRNRPGEAASTARPRPRKQAGGTRSRAPLLGTRASRLMKQMASDGEPTAQGASPGNAGVSPASARRRSCCPICGRDARVPRTLAAVGGAVPQDLPRLGSTGPGFARANRFRSAKWPCEPANYDCADRTVWLYSAALGAAGSHMEDWKTCLRPSSAGLPRPAMQRAIMRQVPPVRSAARGRW